MDHQDVMVLDHVGRLNLVQEHSLILAKRVKFTWICGFDLRKKGHLFYLLAKLPVAAVGFGEFVNIGKAGRRTLWMAPPVGAISNLTPLITIRVPEAINLVFYFSSTIMNGWNYL